MPKQTGATSAVAAATIGAAIAGTFDDLLDASSGMELAEVAPQSGNGTPTTPPGTTLVVVVRNGSRLRADEAGDLRPGDRLIVLRDS